MELIINDDNLKIDEIDTYNSKVRALLIDDNNQILVANYGGVYLLPGGSIEKGETVINAMIRELTEETGQNYEPEELTYLTSLKYFQKNYPNRNNTFQNRLVETFYYLASYKEIIKSSQLLSEKEQKDNFKLELIPLENLERMVLENKTNNPRNIYFQKEMLSILEIYKSTKKDSKVKKLGN